MGRYVMVSLWCESLLTNIRFSVLYFRMSTTTIVKKRLQVKNKPFRHNKFDIQKLNYADTREVYKIKIGGRFEEVLGFKKKKKKASKPWLTM